MDRHVRVLIVGLPLLAGGTAFTWYAIHHPLGARRP
jgi:hypothetical protein